MRVATLILSLAVFIVANCSVEAFPGRGRGVCRTDEDCPTNHECLRHGNGKGRVQVKKCVLIDCGDPTPDNGTADTPDGTTVGQNATLSCDDGFSLSGSEVVTCLVNGEWDDNPTCIKDCGDPTPDNGTADTQDGTTVGQNATLSCDDGFVLSGNEVVTCLVNGEWDDNPTCTDVR